MSNAVAFTVPAPREPLGATLRRNLLLACAAGAGIALPSHSVQRWIVASLVMLWPTLGGHYLELAFLDFIAPRLPQASVVRSMARVLTWLAGGGLLTVAMHLTGQALGDRLLAAWPPLWLGALGMVGIELVIHALRRLRGLPSVFEPRPSRTGAT